MIDCNENRDRFDPTPIPTFCFATSVPLPLKGKGIRGAHSTKKFPPLQGEG